MGDGDGRAELGEHGAIGVAEVAGGLQLVEKPGRQRTEEQAKRRVFE